MFLLSSIIRTHGIDILPYAENTQLIFPFAFKTPNTQVKFSTCMAEIANWMKTTVSN